MIDIVHRIGAQGVAPEAVVTWIGTQVTFDIKQEDAWTIILFGHRGWTSPVEVMNHCSTDNW